GPNDGQNVTFTDAVPANTTFVSAMQIAGPAFSLSSPAPGGTGTVSGTIVSFAAGATAEFQIVVHVNSGTPGSTAITNAATVSMSSTVVVDPNPANDSTTVTTTTTLPIADVSVTKTDS